MNKNNSIDHSQIQPHHKETKNNEIQGKSEFTRSKLQRDYQPKLKTFKHKLLKTSEHQKLVLERLQNEQQELKVVSSALQCFKKGQVINIDWKTKTNFRKSEENVKFPRINTEPLHLMLENHSNKKTNRTNILQIGHQSRSIKHKSIEDKCMKLKCLLNPQMKQSKLFFKSEKMSMHNQSRYQLPQSLIVKEKDQYSKKSKGKFSHQQKNVIISSPVGGLSVNLSQFLSNEKHTDQKDLQVDFSKLRSQTQAIKNIRLPQQSRNKSQRDNSLKLKTQPISRDQNSQNQKSLNKATITTEQNETINSIQGYDILNDPSMYVLIEKTRNKIINFKEMVSLKSMSKLQRMKYQQDKRNSLPDFDKNSRIRSLSLQGGLNSSKLSKEKILQKIEQKKRTNSKKLSNPISRVYTETKQYVNNTSQDHFNQHSQVHSHLNYSTESIGEDPRENKFEERRSKIKSRKKQSLIQVQQKLLKQVKLSLLKQDLTKKFQEIRDNFPKKYILMA